MNNLKTKKNNKEAAWHENFLKLQEFLISKERRYPSFSPNNEEESANKEEIELARWVSYQRRNFTTNQLAQEKIDALNSINFVWRKKNNEWHENFLALKEFVATNDAYPSVSSTINKEQDLASWLITQRSEYKEGTLKQDKINLLETIGPIWNPIEANWHCYLNRLNKFVKENYRYPSTDSKDNNEKSIAIWVNSQRRAIKNQKISLERHKILKDNNFVEKSETNQNSLEK